MVFLKMGSGIELSSNQILEFLENFNEEKE
jgi:hypothetical protein